MTKDFYEITNGNWTTSDLLLLKSALAEVNLLPKSKITYLDFLNGLIEEPKFLAKLLDEINLENVDAVYTTILETVKKYQQLEGDEKYLVETISDFMTEQNVKLPSRKIATGLVTKYINNIASVSLSAEIPIYEFCLELLYNFEQLDYAEIQNNSSSYKSVYPNSDDDYIKAYEYEYGYNDLAVAKYWYQKSAEKGNLAAKRALIRLGIK